MKNSLFLFVCSLVINIAFTTPSEHPDTTCSAPANVTKTAQTETSVSFDWDDCGCNPTEYQVYYTVGSQTSSVYSTTSSDITFTGLTDGTYRFHFYTVCGTEVSSIIIDEVLIG